jgi:hypothetical protein
VLEEHVAPSGKATPIDRLDDLGRATRLRRPAPAPLAPRGQEAQTAYVGLLVQCARHLVEPAGLEAQVVLSAHEHHTVGEVEGTVHATV